MRYALANKSLHALMVCICLGALIAAGSATAQEASSTGGAAFMPPPPPPKKAKLLRDGTVLAPRSAPSRVKRVIAAANRLIGLPYRYGGGHRPYSRGLDTGYDCSGSVSFALHGGRFLRSPLPSTDLMSWARSRPGRWITVYANGGHAYLVVAGLRFDTGLRDDPRHTGPAWSKRLRRNSSYVPRHPRGY